MVVLNTVLSAAALARDELCRRFIRFYASCRKFDNSLLKNYMFLGEDTLAASLTGRNVSYVCARYGLSISQFLNDDSYLDNVLCSFSNLCHVDVSPSHLNLLQELLLIRNDVLECSTDNFLEKH